MLKSLIRLANDLDHQGLYKEADAIDRLIIKASDEWERFLAEKKDEESRFGLDDPMDVPEPKALIREREKDPWRRHEVSILDSNGRPQTIRSDQLKAYTGYYDLDAWLKDNGDIIRTELSEKPDYGEGATTKSDRGESILTYFLGRDFGSGYDRLWFETNVLGDKYEQLLTRYDTMEKAVAGHDEIVNKIKQMIRNQTGKDPEVTKDEVNESWRHIVEANRASNDEW